MWFTKFWNMTCKHYVEWKIIFFASIFMFLWLHMYPHPISCHFQPPRAQMKHPGFRLNSKNQRFLVITFNVIVSSLNIWYNYNFFNVKQIRHKICHKFMIQHGGGAHVGQYVRIDSHQSPIFIPKFRIYDQCITSSTWSPSSYVPPYWNIVFLLIWFYTYFTWK